MVDELACRSELACAVVHRNSHRTFNVPTITPAYKRESRPLGRQRYSWLSCLTGAHVLSVSCAGDSAGKCSSSSNKNGSDGGGGVFLLTYLLL